MQLGIRSDLQHHCPCPVAQPQQMAAGTLLGHGDFVRPQAATRRKVADCCLHDWYQAAERGLGMWFLVLGPKAQIPTPTPHSILSGRWCTKECSSATAVGG